MVELARDTQIKAAECGDWTPPAELQAHLLSLMQTGRLQEQQSLLAKLIENDVIPRLLLANRPELAIASPAADEMAARLAQRVGEFSELVVKQDEAAVIAYVDKLRDEGVSIEGLFQDLSGADGPEAGRTLDGRHQRLLRRDARDWATPEHRPELRSGIQ